MSSATEASPAMREDLFAPTASAPRIGDRVATPRRSRMYAVGPRVRAVLHGHQPLVRGDAVELRPPSAAAIVPRGLASPHERATRRIRTEIDRSAADMETRAVTDERPPRQATGKPHPQLSLRRRIWRAASSEPREDQPTSQSRGGAGCAWRSGKT